MKAEASGTGTVEETAGLRGKARRTHDALAAAAVEIVLERGLDVTTVELITERAGVTRRTFSRYFAGKEIAALAFVRDDGERINTQLRRRPAGEPPLLAYRRAVHAWLTDVDDPPWHVRPDARRILALIGREPALFAAYERIRLDAQAESTRIVAARIGAAALPDPRLTLVDAAAGTLSSALRQWARVGGSAAELTALVERAYDVLVEEAIAAAAAVTRESLPEGATS